jgi:hypothetical protein
LTETPARTGFGADAVTLEGRQLGLQHAVAAGHLLDGHGHHLLSGHEVALGLLLLAPLVVELTK